MITSIVVTGCYNIKNNSSNKIKIGENILSVEKDIPFIRYRFDNYGADELDYIDRMMKQFSASTHLAEIKLNANVLNTITLLSQRFNNIAKYVYIDITDEEIKTESLSAEKLQQLQSIKEFKIDRFMIKDRSTMLDNLSFRRVTKQLATLLGKNDDGLYGVCSSPLSFGDLCCLTAVKARELMSTYSSVADVALPSANHQCMNCCGCIRYMVVDSDLEAPSDGKVKTPKDETTKTVKAPKVTYVPGSFSL